MNKQHYILISKTFTLPASAQLFEAAMKNGSILVFKNWNLTANNIAANTETSDLTGEIATVSQAKVGFQATFRPTKSCVGNAAANIQALCEIIANPCNDYKYFAFMNIKNGAMEVTTKFNKNGVAELYNFSKNLDPAQIFVGISNPAIVLTDQLGEWTEGVSKQMVTYFELDESDIPVMRVISLIKSGTGIKVVDTSSGQIEVLLTTPVFSINGVAVTSAYAAGVYTLTSPAPAADDIITVEDDNILLFEPLIY